MADSRAKVPSRVEDFRRRLDVIENELRLLPQNLCVLLTHTPLTQEGSQYSLFEGKGSHRLGPHWLSEGELPYYPLVGQPPELFPFGTDRFPFGVVLSRTSSLLELTVDAEDRTWLNFGGKCGFYVTSDTVRDSLPAGPSAHELTERTIWHYFAENPGDPIPEKSSFESVYAQLLHCYRGIRETCMEIEGQLSLGGDELTRIIYELDWPEVLLYLGLKNPGPFFGVDLGSIVRSFQGEQLIPWGKLEECHSVFRVRPASVARATSYALEALGRMVHAVDKPAAGGGATVKRGNSIPFSGGDPTTHDPGTLSTNQGTGGKNNDPNRKERNRLTFWAAIRGGHFDAEGKCIRTEPYANKELIDRGMTGNPSEMFPLHLKDLVTIEWSKPRELYEWFCKNLLETDPGTVYKYVLKQLGEKQARREKQASSHTTLDGKDAAWKGRQDEVDERLDRESSD